MSEEKHIREPNFVALTVNLRDQIPLYWPSKFQWTMVTPTQILIKDK